MICEFALEPGLVATWHNRREYLYFDEKFGLKTGRIVSIYPGKWISLVWEQFKNGPSGDDQNAQMRLSALIQDLSQNTIKRRDSFSDISAWLERAIAEHKERRFHAILASTNSQECDEVIHAGELIKNGHELWLTKDDPVVERSASEIVAAVSPLLRLCSTIIFVDPYFNPKRMRFTEPFSGYTDKIWNQRYGINDPTVELHTGIDRFFESWETGEQRDQTEEKTAVKNLTRDLESILPRFIPKGKKVLIFLWTQKEQGEKLHNRYILTECAGVLFGTGLDQAEDFESKETDDLSLMSPTQLDIRWKQFKSSPPAFDLVAKPFSITGIA